MSILTAPPPCSCCDTVRQYIADHLDRDGLIKPTDDPSETLAIFDRCFAEDGGSGLDLKDVAAYIEELGEDAMLENGDD